MSEKPIDVSIAKKSILRDLGAPKDDIDAVRTNAEADELIAYLKSKVPAPEPKKNEKPKVVQIPTNLGKPLDIPAPEEIQSDRKYNSSLEERFNAMNPIHGEKSRWLPISRLSLNPNGEMF